MVESRSTSGTASIRTLINQVAPQSLETCLFLVPFPSRRWARAGCRQGDTETSGQLDRGQDSGEQAPVGQLRLRPPAHLVGTLVLYGNQGRARGTGYMGLQASASVT